MKCYICGKEIPDGSKYCNYCGRIFTAKDRQRAEAESAEAEMTGTPKTEANGETEEVKTFIFSQENNNDPSDIFPDARKKSAEDAPKTEKPTGDRTYRPASAGYAQNAPSGNSQNASSDDTIHMPDMNIHGEDSPQYRQQQDRDAFSRATEDVINYDRQYGSGAYDDGSYDPGRRAAGDQPQLRPENRGQTRDNDADDSGITDGKPHLQSGAKKTIIAVVVVAVLVLCAIGVFKIGKSIGIWGSEETTADVADVLTSAEPTTEEASTTPKAGLYTVSSTEKNIVMYKDASSDQVFASIPDDTVIFISEISGDYGKTTYGTYEGWVSLSDVKSTPDAEGYTGTDETTTTASSDGTGEYKVNLNGEGDNLNVRSMSSTEGTVITTVADGTTVTVQKTENGWGYINVNGYSGWVSMNYLEKN